MYKHHHMCLILVHDFKCYNWHDLMADEGEAHHGIEWRAAERDFHALAVTKPPILAQVYDETCNFDGPTILRMLPLSTSGMI